MDLSALAKHLKTKEDANNFINLLEKISGSLYKNDENILGLLTSSTSYEEAKEIESLLKEQNIALQDKTKIGPFLTKLSEQVASLPVVHMILACAPNKDLIDDMQHWFFVNFKKLVLLDITIDKELISGAVVSFNGRANDYSLKNRIESTGGSL